MNEDDTILEENDDSNSNKEIIHDDTNGPALIPAASGHHEGPSCSKGVGDGEDEVKEKLNKKIDQSFMLLDDVDSQCESSGDQKQCRVS